jgi:predicted NBD/HSP70 family sugar kinase
VVLGLPCSIDERTGRVSYNEILPGWVGLDPAVELAGRCGTPVRVENDANLAALGENVHGAARGVRDLIFVKVSRGIGAGLILGGRLYRGASGVAGNVGHVVVAPGGEICRCGNRGCLETVAAAPQVLAGVGAALGREVRIEELAALVHGGNVGARRAVADAGHRIGQCLADLCGVLNPAVVVVGGELAETGSVFVSAIHDSLTRYTQPVVAEAVTVRAGELGARAEVLGALALAAATAAASAASAASAGVLPQQSADS